MAFPKGTTLDWDWEDLAEEDIPAEIARDAEVAGQISDHAGIPDAHHAKYTDAEAQATVKANVEVGDLKAPTKPLDMNSQKITGLPTPTAGSDAATKDLVDSMVQGLDWQPSVLGELDTPPGSPTTGDRYLIIATATGDWAGHEKDIAEWDGLAWIFTTPNKGFAVWLEDVGRQKNFNGTDWVFFGSTVDHSSLTGVGPSDHHVKTGNYEVFGLTEKVTSLPVAAAENLGRFMRERASAGQTTRVCLCVENSADGYEWIQLGIST